MRGNSDISVRNIKWGFYVLQVSYFIGVATGFCPALRSFPVQQQIEDFSRFLGLFALNVIVDPEKLITE